MGRFYLDTEYTNGNYYRGDIFEIALVSEETCRVFHQYVRIPYNICEYVKRLCNINDEVIRHKGVSFNFMLDRLLRFVKSETNTPILIAHAGYLFDFPILFVNCMKHNIDIADTFANFTFIDTLRVLKERGEYTKSSLKSIANISFHHHSAKEDAKTLMYVFTKQYSYAELLNKFTKEECESSLKFSTNDILDFLVKKLPITIQQLRKIVSSVESRKELIPLLEQYVLNKSALNRKQIVKLSHYAYKYFR